jgi:putative transposase
VTNPTYRRARHSVSLLHAHLVLVTKYRPPVITDAMLTFCECTVRDVGADLDAELVEFNGEADHVHLLVADPPNLAISTPVQRLKGPTAHTIRREFTGACVRAAVDHQATHRRPSTPTLSVGLRQTRNKMD